MALSGAPHLIKCAKNILRYRKAGGKTEWKWKKTSGYHRRSLVETHMMRLKSILGGNLRGRKLANQKTEARIMAKILNKMTSLGMPKTEALQLI